jgi:hypothetical protein
LTQKIVTFFSASPVWLATAGREFAEMLGGRARLRRSYGVRAPQDLKPGQKFENAFKEMEKNGIGDGNADKSRRVEIYEKHGMDRAQWSRIYLKHVSDFPNSALGEIQAPPAAVEPPALIKTRRTKKVKLGEKNRGSNVISS